MTYKRILKERKEENDKNTEFKVERITGKGKEIITESVDNIITNIESGVYKYYIDDSKIEIIDDKPKYLRSSSNDNKSDNIDNLPKY